MSETETRRIFLTHDVIECNSHAEFLQGAEGGAIDLFLGTTRRFTKGVETVSLAYEAAPELAQADLSRILDETCDRWPVLRAVIIHRLGDVQVSEISVLVGISTPHRAASFEACRFVIDELKKSTPIWKKEIFAAGGTEWVEGVVPQ